MVKCYLIHRHNFFDKYRGRDATKPEPQKFSDCAKVHTNCKAAEKYNVKDDDDDDEGTETAAGTTSLPEETTEMATEAPQPQQSDDKDNDIDTTTQQENRPMYRKYKLLKF